MTIPPPPGAPVPLPPPPPAQVPQPQVVPQIPAAERIAADVKVIRGWVTFIGIVFAVWVVLGVLWFFAVVAAFS